MVETTRRATIAGFLLVAGFLALLYVLPKFTRKTQYTLETAPPATPALSQFPLETKFRTINIDGAKRVSTGKEVALGDLLTKERDSLVVNFWATWCPPCIEEMPSLEFLNRQLKAKSGSAPLIVAISVDERVEDIQTLMKTFEFAPSFVILHDPSGKFAESVGTTKFPETYLVQKDGAVLFKWGGPQDWLSRDVLMQLAKTSRK